MKNDLPYFAFYVSDFHANTAHLNLEEDGALNRLWRILWNTPGCSIPNDDEWIQRKMRVGEDIFRQTVKPVIDEFLELQNERLHSPELSKRWLEAQAARQRKVEAGKRSAEVRSIRRNR